MKAFWKTKLIALAFLTLFTSHCGSTIDAPDQGLTNIVWTNATNGFIEVILGSLKGITDCASFNAAVQNVVDTAGCDIQGDLEISAVDIQCQEGPPLTVSVTYSATASNCEDVEQVTTGVFTMVLNWVNDGSNAVADITANSTITIQGEDINFKGDITVDVNVATMDATCSAMPVTMNTFGCSVVSCTECLY